MSPGGRRGRTGNTSEESHLRDLSPNDTLRAFTERPVPFDTSRDEYKIFACVDSLTPAERDLGVRVAKAAQRLKSWCQEIEQWGWSGSFAQPSEEFRETRRRSLEMRIREHVKDSNSVETIPPLEYWGSLLSVEVEAHEARLDEIGDELLLLDIEELKEHVLEMYGADRSRPSSSGYDAPHRTYTPMDDFSFLITQTLLSALPAHFQVKERLNTWTARVSVLREAPRFLQDLKTAQKAMQLGWDAIDPPTDSSDSASDKWKVAVNTISGVLRDKVGDLGQRLDRMLDTLEGHEDCLPDDWIDIFEGVETDHGRWVHESRRRIIDLEVRRRGERHKERVDSGESSDKTDVVRLHSSAPKVVEPTQQPKVLRQEKSVFVDESPEIPSSPTKKAGIGGVSILKPKSTDNGIHHSPTFDQSFPATPQPYVAPTTPPFDEPDFYTKSVEESLAKPVTASVETFTDDVSVYEEEDTVLHNDFEDSDDTTSAVENTVQLPSKSVTRSIDELMNPVVVKHKPTVADVVPQQQILAIKPTDKPTDPVAVHSEPLVLVDAEEPARTEDRPQTPPRSRRNSTDSVSSVLSYSSSPVSAIEESPSVRNATNRHAKAPRPELNAAMGKRRTGKNGKPTPVEPMAPWPPSQFSQQLSPNSTEDLERKISDILTTIPAHIRLTSGPGADSREVKPTRGVLTSRGSRGYLRAARSVSGLKSPELTLSPARNESDSSNMLSGRRSNAALRPDNDIRLYHLTQAGKEHPVKLFIRRVGENGERVMVRVGGGWADLGEYLKNYAEHHGRRTASEGKFEILGLEVKGPDSPRPESAMSKRTVNSPNTTPKKSFGMGVGKDEVPPPMPSLTGTPITAAADISSAPSTGSSRHSWQGNEVGLAGPKSKKLDLSERKIEWIEGMMKQARTVSGNLTTMGSRSDLTAGQSQQREGGESRSESRNGNGARKPEFGDLGKVGGTKRLFVKGGQLSEH